MLLCFMFSLGFGGGALPRGSPLFNLDYTIDIWKDIGSNNQLDIEEYLIVWDSFSQFPQTFFTVINS